MTTFRILSVDGGGIRGVIPAIWLSRIAQKSDRPLDQCFDLIVGTSTGAIVGAAAALGKDISDCINLYSNFGPSIFPKDVGGSNAWKLVEKVIGPIYSDSPLQDALQKLFAINTKLEDANTPLMVVSYDVLGRQMFLMKSYDELTSQLPVWEACKASCSAPTFFPAHTLNHSGIRRPLIDGGVFANNPSVLALSEAIRLNAKDSIREFHEENSIVLVSLGTGNLQRSITVENAQTWGSLRWIRPLIDVLFDSSAELSHFCARHILTTDNYVRLQIDLNDVSDDMDDASEENINRLKLVAETFLESSDGGDKFDKIMRLVRP